MSHSWRIAIGVFIVSAMVRILQLGQWPFDGDELYTFAEERAFVEGSPNDDPISRLPWILPLGHGLLSLGYTLFGRDEFGSRLLPALAGALAAAIASLLTEKRTTSLAVGGLIALWPDHIFYSQFNRFYSFAGLFATVSLFVGAVAVRRSSTVWLVAACTSAIAAMFCHTLAGSVFLLVGVGTLFGRWPLPRAMSFVLFLVMLAMGAIYFAYLRPLTSDWNHGASWGYGPVRSGLGAVNMIGWPTAVLAGLGTLLLFREATPEHRFWAVAVLGWGASCVIFPLIVVYHPAYSFPLAVSAVFVAAHAIGTIGERLRPLGGFVVWSWILAALALNLPSLASYVLDGSRHDFRPAAKIVNQEWHPTDRIAGSSTDILAHYAGGLKTPAVNLASGDPVARLEELTAKPGRIWVVLPSGRSGLPDSLANWLGRHAEHRLRTRRVRYDYQDFCVDVYLIPAGNSPP